MKLIAQNESDTKAYAQQLASALQPPLIVNLSGQIGAGKTFFTRSLLQAFNFKGKVKSPTFTIVEPYELNEFDFYHFDFYRISDPDELDFLGIQDYFYNKSVCFLEWPENAGNKIGQADITITISIVGQSRVFDITSTTQQGATILKILENIRHEVSQKKT